MKRTVNTWVKIPTAQGRKLFATGLALVLMSACTTIQVEDWVLTDANSDITTISQPYWSAIIVDDKDGNSSDGYLLVESTSGEGSSRVWTATGRDLTEDKGKDKIWLRFRALNEDLLLVQSTSFDKGGRLIELYPVRKQGPQEYRIYAVDNDRIQEWARQQPLIEELGDHVTIGSSIGSYTIRFDAYASQNHSSEIIELMAEMDQEAEAYQSGAYFELKGFDDLEDLKAYARDKTKKME